MNVLRAIIMWRSVNFVSRYEIIKISNHACWVLSWPVKLLSPVPIGWSILTFVHVNSRLVRLLFTSRYTSCPIRFPSRVIINIMEEKRQVVIAFPVSATQCLKCTSRALKKIWHNDAASALFHSYKLNMVFSWCSVARCFTYQVFWVI